jgi:hypothetical protein
MPKEFRKIPADNRFRPRHFTASTLPCGHHAARWYSTSVSISVYVVQRLVAAQAQTASLVFNHSKYFFSPVHVRFHMIWLLCMSVSTLTFFSHTDSRRFDFSATLSMSSLVSMSSLGCCFVHSVSSQILCGFVIRLLLLRNRVAE